MADELQHPTGTPGDDGQDVNLDGTFDDTTLDTNPDDDTAGDEDTGGNADAPNQKKSSKTPEELDELRRAAVKSLYSEKNKVKQARAQLDAYDNELLDLARDDLSIVDRLYAKNPERADKITQALFNMTYQEALQKAQNMSNKQGTTPDVDIDALVEQKVLETLGKKDRAAEADTVQKELDRLVASTGLNPTGYKFKRLMRELNDLGKPVTVKQARAFFSAAQSALDSGSDDVEDVDMGSIPSLSGGIARSTSRIPMPSEAYFEAAKMNGHSREVALKAWKKSQASKGMGL